VTRPAPVRGRVRSVPPAAPKPPPTAPAQGRPGELAAEREPAAAAAEHAPAALETQPEQAPAVRDTESEAASAVPETGPEPMPPVPETRSEPSPAVVETQPEAAPPVPEAQPEPAPFASAPLAPTPLPEPASVPQSPAVPVWAVREPAPAAPPASETAGPHALAAKLTLRSGASSVVVDDRRLQLRTWFKRRTLAWTEVQGFEARVDVGKGGNRQATTGRIVAITVDGPVEMPGTRRTLAELRYVRDLLDAYRDRATPER
jgi:hypothetical protein